jgi:hypothetical protein
MNFILLRVDLALIILVVCLVLGAGCTEEPADASSPVHLSPLPLERGKIVSIQYDPSSMNAKFRKAEELFVTVDVKHNHGVDSYRMKLDYGSGQYESKFKVPMNACYIAFSIGPREQVMYTETFSSAVYEDGKPVEHALPHLIYGSRSYDEATEFFRTDESYYPSTADRFQPMWISRINYGIDTVGIIHEIDSLYNSAAGMERLNENTLTALAACASGYYALGHYNRAKTAFSALSLSVDDKTKLSLSALGGIAYIVYDYTNRCMGGATMPEDGEQIRIFDEILLIGEKCNDFNIATLILRNAQLCKQSAVGQAFWNNGGNLDGLLRIARRVEGDDNIRSMELISGLADVLFEQRRHADVIALIKDRRDELQKATYWVRDSKEEIVSNFPAYGHYAEIQRSYGQSLIESGDMEYGRAVLKSLFENRVRSETIHAYSLAAAYLTKSYTEEERFDLAEKYLAFSILLESRESAELLVALNKRRSASNASPLDGNAFVKRHFNAKLLVSYKAPDINIETDLGNVTLTSQSKHATVLLFFSSDCSICKTVIPELLGGITESMNPETRIIILADIPKTKLDAAIGPVPCKYEYATFGSEILRALKIPGFPHAVIVRDGDIKYKGSVDAVYSAQKFAALLY